MKETREQIDDLLAQLEQQMNQQDDARDQESQPPQGYRLIDVHIYHSEEEPAEEEAATIEGTIQEAEHTHHKAEPQPEQEAPAPRTAKASAGYRKPLLLALVLLSLMMFEAVIGLSARPLLAPEATIVITPVHRQIEMQASISIEEGAVGAGAVRGRALALTMSQEQTIKTTGTAYQQARSAEGVITFYNAAPYVQTVPAGTLINGAVGMQIVTEQDAIIPAVSYPTLGATSVAAHAAAPGSAGNREAGAIYGPCCRLNVSAVSSAFSGGANARTYPTATREEITTAGEQISQKLEQSIAAALDAQLTPEETMLAPTCTQTTATSHQPGEEAAEIQITLDATCTATAYNRSQYEQVITKHLDQQAYTQLGEGYRLTGKPEHQIIKATPKEHAVTLLVTIRGTYGYQFSQAEQEQIKGRVVGKSIAQASEAVMNTRGVQAVAISINNHAAALPTESKSISLVFLVR